MSIIYDKLVIMSDTYKIVNISPSTDTYIEEYWNGKKMRQIVVRARYNGGDILSFIQANEHYTSWFNYSAY